MSRRGWRAEPTNLSTGEQFQRLMAGCDQIVPGHIRERTADGKAVAGGVGNDREGFGDNPDMRFE